MYGGVEFGVTLIWLSVKETEPTLPALVIWASTIFSGSPVVWYGFESLVSGSMTKVPTGRLVSSTSVTATASGLVEPTTVTLIVPGTVNLSQRRVTPTVYVVPLGVLRGTLSASCEPFNCAERAEFDGEMSE